MFHRNVVRFADTDGREIELLAEGTMWPKEIIVNGDAWLMGEVVDVGPNFVVREYVAAVRQSPGQRLLRAIQGGG